MQELISPLQIKAARALLNWKQTDLAKYTHLSEPTVNRAENNETFSKISKSTLNIIQKTFNEHKVVFITDESGSFGVKLNIIKK